MASWNEFVSGAKKTFNKAAVKVGEVADNAAESLKIESLKIKLSERYEELGRIVYEEVKSEKTNAARVGEKAAEIDALLAQIEELKAKKKNKKSDKKAENKEVEAE
ncbi:MAG: hypothetical protein IJX27_07580 [Clostridia bacterium]|nr:hypothetical protein [Clostridia bacterium]